MTKPWIWTKFVKTVSNKVHRSCENFGNMQCNNMLKENHYNWNHAKIICKHRNMQCGHFQSVLSPWAFENFPVIYHCPKTLTPTMAYIEISYLTSFEQCAAITQQILGTIFISKICTSGSSCTCWTLRLDSNAVIILHNLPVAVCMYWEPWYDIPCTFSFFTFHGIVILVGLLELNNSTRHHTNKAMNDSPRLVFWV